MDPQKSTSSALAVEQKSKSRIFTPTDEGRQKIMEFPSKANEPVDVENIRVACGIANV